MLHPVINKKSEKVQQLFPIAGSQTRQRILSLARSSYRLQRAEPIAMGKIKGEYFRCKVNDDMVLQSV